MKAVLLKAGIVCGFMLAILFHPLALHGQDLNLDQAKAGADKGDANAEFCLAKFYANGQGVPQDFAKAAALYRKAAEQGFGKAQNNLGVLYLQGKGVPKDEAEAINWLQKAADQGLTKSQSTLAAILIKKDASSQQAVDLYRKLAEQGDVNAQLHLGDTCYFGTKTIKRDYVEAAKWYSMAANKGNAVGENAIGAMNESGFGMPENDKAAFEWFRKAAEQGNAKGESNLGRMYADGTGGIELNRPKAYMWLSVSAAQGETTAQNFLNEWVAELKPQDLAEGKRLLDAYNASHGTHIATYIGH